MAATGCSRLDTSIKRQSKQDSAFLIPERCPLSRVLSVFCLQSAAENALKARQSVTGPVWSFIL